MKNIMDNQQATTIGYIAGLMDGEGTFALTVHQYKKRPNYRVAIQVSNTDIRILKEFIRFLKEYEITYWVCSYKPKKRKRRVQYSIAIASLNGKIKFIDLVYPFLQAKQEQAYLLKEFCIRRLKENQKKPIRNKLGQFVYGGNRKFNWIDDLFYKEYKAIVESSETTSRTLYKFK